MKRLLCLLAGCLLLAAGGAAEASEIVLSGAGATFPAPLYETWFDAYHQEAGLRFGYQAKGSGAGIRLLKERKVDFGATDAFLSGAEIGRGPEQILHIPTCLGAVAVVYHLPGNPPVRLTPGLIGDIFLGKIVRWNDPRIGQANPAVDLPELSITVVHRSEKSGTTFLFTDYLSKAHPDWRRIVGRGKAVSWPVGIGLEGNPGVADMVERIVGSIGYVSLSYAEKNDLAFAAVKNRAGRFILPSLASVTNAAAVDLPADTRILITDSDAPEGYPISAFTYLIFYREQQYQQRSRQRAEALAAFLRWAVGKGQQYTSGLGYAPLPARAAKLADRIISSMRYGDRPIFER